MKNALEKRKFKIDLNESYKKAKEEIPDVVHRKYFQGKFLSSTFKMVDLQIYL